MPRRELLRTTAFSIETNSTAWSALDVRLGVASRWLLESPGHVNLTGNAQTVDGFLPRFWKMVADMWAHRKLRGGVQPPDSAGLSVSGAHTRTPAAPLPENSVR